MKIELAFSHVVIQKCYMGLVHNVDPNSDLSDDHRFAVLDKWLKNKRTAYTRTIIIAKWHNLVEGKLALNRWLSWGIFPIQLNYIENTFLVWNMILVGFFFLMPSILTHEMGRNLCRTLYQSTFCYDDWKWQQTQNMPPTTKLPSMPMAVVLPMIAYSSEKVTYCHWFLVFLYELLCV